MKFRTLNQRERNQTKEELESEVRGNYSRFAIPEVYYKDGSIKLLKHLTNPPHPTDDTLTEKTPYYSERWMHELRVGGKQVLGPCFKEACKNTPGAACYVSEEATKKKDKLQKGTPEFDLQDQIGWRFRANRYHAYLVADFTDLMRPNGSLRPFPVRQDGPCYGKREQMDADDPMCLDCPMLKSCGHQLSIYLVKFIPQGKQNPGWRLFQCWNGIGDTKERVFDVGLDEMPADKDHPEPWFKERDARTLLIRGSRTGKGQTDTDYQFQISSRDDVIVPRHVMTRLSEELGDRTMKDLVWDVLVWDMAGMQENVKGALVELEGEKEKGDFDPAKFANYKKEEEKAPPRFSSKEVEATEVAVVEHAKASRKKAAKVEQPKAEAKVPEIAIDDPDNIAWIEVDGVPVPACRGGFNPNEWSKCRKLENGKPKDPDLLCPIRSQCMEMSETEVDPEDATEEPAPTGGNPWKVADEAAVRYHAEGKKKSATPIPCFAQEKLRVPGKTPMCIKCEKEWPIIFAACADAIAQGLTSRPAA